MTCPRLHSLGGVETEAGWFQSVTSQPLCSTVSATVGNDFPSLEGNGPQGSNRAWRRGKAPQCSNLASLGMNWQGIAVPMPGAAEASARVSTLGFFSSFLLLTPQSVTSQMERSRVSRHAGCPAFCQLGEVSSTHQGMRRPRRVQEDLLMQKPTKGSVKASQARPTNRMMEAEKGSTWNGEHMEDDPLILLLTSTLNGRQKQGLPPRPSQVLGTVRCSHPGLKHLCLPIDGDSNSSLIAVSSSTCLRNFSRSALLCPPFHCP